MTNRRQKDEKLSKTVLENFKDMTTAANVDENHALAYKVAEEIYELSFNFPNGPIDSSTNLYTVISTLDRTEGLYSKFLKLPSDHQEYIFSILSQWSGGWNAHLYYKAFMLSKASRKDIEDFRSPSSNSAVNQVFMAEVHRIILATRVRTSKEILENVLIMLALAQDKGDVLSFLQKALDEKYPWSSIDFVEVIEHWDEYSAYPLAWTASVLTSVSQEEMFSKFVGYLEREVLEED